MSASKLASDPRLHGHRRRHVDPETASATVKRPDRKRPDCRDVARNRAARYARRHRIAKPLWPIISAFVLIGLIFERRPSPALFRTEEKTASDGVAGARAAMPEPGKYRDIDRVPAARMTGGAARGNPKLQYRPPADFLATRKEIIQIVAFLIRNRGRLDTDPVRMKWEILDRASLPLAVFMREIEAASAWDDLEEEIAATHFNVPHAPGMGLPKSIRHRKLLLLIPEWTRRGEELLSPEPTIEAIPTPTPDSRPTSDGDGGPDTRPRTP